MNIILFFVFMMLVFSLKYNSNISIKYNYRCKNLNKSNIVVDCFTYFQESLMLSIRLFRMDEYVDCFLVVISDTTHSGLPLKISFHPFKKFINKYKNKIMFHRIHFPPQCKESWCKENYQRISIEYYIKSLNINNDSIILISDLDEIPTADAMKYIKRHPPHILYMLSGYMYFYNYRNLFEKSWPGVIVVKKKNCFNIQKYRDKRYSLKKRITIPVHPSLTHCSFCFKNITLIQIKLKSFAHTEYNKPPYINREHIINCIKKHLHITKLSKLHVVDYNSRLLPLPNDDRFTYLKDLYTYSE